MPFSVEIKGLTEVRKILKQYEHFVDKKVRKVVDELMREGEEYAANELGHIDTGETLASLQKSVPQTVGFRKGDKAVLFVGGNAIWIEFGTGVSRNSGNEHPPVVSSPVPIYKHGEYGQGKGKNPEGWVYFNNDDGQFHHTYGIRGNAFMYRTYEHMINQLPEYARKIFEDEKA